MRTFALLALLAVAAGPALPEAPRRREDEDEPSDDDRFEVAAPFRTSVPGTWLMDARDDRARRIQARKAKRGWN